MTGGGHLFGVNGTMFMPKAGIQKSDRTKTDMNVLIEVKSYSQTRTSLEEDMRHFVGEDLKAAMEDASGKLVLKWWDRKLEGGKGAEVVDEDGTHVWWEIADVNVVYEDPERK